MRENGKTPPHPYPCWKSLEPTVKMRLRKVYSDNSRQPGPVGFFNKQRIAWNTGSPDVSMLTPKKVITDCLSSADSKHFSKNMLRAWNKISKQLYWVDGVKTVKMIIYNLRWDQGII